MSQNARTAGSGEVGFRDVWRDPAEETVGLYPNLVVHDGRQSGSITIGRSRLPVWCFIGELVADGWSGVEHGWEPSEYGFDDGDFTEFLCDLLEMRGEFARLLLTLANAERGDSEREDEWLRAHDDGSGIVAIPLEDYPPADHPQPWWRHEPSRTAVLDSLRSCVAALESGGPVGGVL